MSAPLCPLFLAFGLAILPGAMAEETASFDAETLPPGFSISVRTDDDGSVSAPPERELAVEAAPDGSVEARLDRLEANMLRQQALLERVVENLERDSLGVGVPPVPAVPTPSVQLPSIGQQAIASFGGPVEVGKDESVEEAVAFGSPVRVEGTVLGDAVAFGEDVIVTSTGHVTGDAVSFGGRVRIEPGGRVDGDRVALASEDTPASASGLAMLAEKGGSWMHHMVRRTVLLLCLAGIGVLLLGLFPDKVINTARGLERHPFRYGIAGLLLTGTGVVVAGLLAITIIGLPISAFVILLLGLAWLLGFVALGQVVGDLLPVPERFQGKVGAFLVGVCLLGAMSFVPYLGKLLIFFSLFPCIGAAVGTRFGASEG
jgi:hypothetical protein